MSKGRRYDNEKKLNMKKVFAVIIAIVVIIMFVCVIRTLLNNNGEKVSGEAYFTAYKDNKYGVINSKGIAIIEPSYAEMIVIPNNKKDVFVCTYDVDYTNSTYKTKVLNSKNVEIFKDYSSVEALDNFDEQNNIYYNTEALKVSKDNKFGLIDFNGKEILECEYDKIHTLKGTNNSIIVEKDNKLGLVDNKGKTVLNTEYTDIKKLSEDNKLGYIVGNDNDKYGIVDITDKTVLEMTYEDIKDISGDGIYAVKENGKWKIVNSTNENTANMTFDDIKDIRENNIIVSNANKYGVINKFGEEIIPTQYQDIDFAFTDTFIVKQNNKYGVAKKGNQIVLNIEYSKISYIEKADFIEASVDGIESDIITSDLNIKLSGIISEIDIDKGYFAIRTYGEYKYYNFKFEENNSKDILTSNTLFLSKENGKYGYIDKEGNTVVDYIYDDAKEQNTYGFAAVNKDGKWGSIDRKGNIVRNIDIELDNNLKIDFVGEWYLLEDLNMNCYTKK